MINFTVMHSKQIEDLYKDLKKNYPQYYHNYDRYLDKMYKLALDYSNYIYDGINHRNFTISKKDAGIQLNAIINNHFHLVIT